MSPVDKVSFEPTSSSSGSQNEPAESEILTKVSEVRKRVKECKEVFRSSLNDVADMREELLGLENIIKTTFGPNGDNLMSPVPTGVTGTSPVTPELALSGTSGSPKIPVRRSPRLANRSPASNEANPGSRNIFLLSPDLARNRRRHLGIDSFCSTSAQRLCTRILCFLDGHFPLEISVSELNDRAKNLSDARFRKIDANVASVVFKMLRTMSRQPGGAASSGTVSAGLEVPRGISPLDWHLWSVRGAMEYK